MKNLHIDNIVQHIDNIVPSKGTHTTLQTESSYPKTFYGESLPFDGNEYKKYLQTKVEGTCCGSNQPIGINNGQQPIGSAYQDYSFDATYGGCDQSYAPAFGVDEIDLVKKFGYVPGYDPILPCHQNQVTYHSHHQDILKNTIQCQRLSQRIIDELAQGIDGEEVELEVEEEGLPQVTIVPPQQEDQVQQMPFSPPGTGSPGQQVPGPGSGSQAPGQQVPVSGSQAPGQQMPFSPPGSGSQAPGQQMPFSPPGSGSQASQALVNTSCGQSTITWLIIIGLVLYLLSRYSK